MALVANTNSPTRRNSPPVRFNSTNSITKSRSKSLQERRTRASKLELQLRLRLETAEKDIFDWYEENKYTEDAGVIYSPEWQGRLIEWGKEFDSSIDSDTPNNIELLRKDPEKLELGLFFQVHPIAAFSLWNVLQACYELDRVICGTTKEDRVKIMEWQKWRPFQYLLSQEVISLWGEKLRVLSSGAKECTDKFEKEKIAERLQDIAQAVQALEQALSTFTSVVDGKRGRKPCPTWVLNRVQESVTERCRHIQEM
ncbi:hypothetical protein GGR54DRAFT_563921 [Hypoxylon sp. NC1633]|nr:hypothetical protein GGR54DRAFT_563921 [Hypoxylon sp. NC1633]